MIDYEKLKEAHALINKLNLYVKINIIIREDNCWIFDARFNNDLDDDNAITDIDELLNKLHKLSEPKCKVTQQVWFMDCTQRDAPISSGFIEKITSLEGLWGIYYNIVHIGELRIPEDCVYPTKQALIHDQLQFWSKLYDARRQDQSQVDADRWQKEVEFSKGGSGYDVDRCQHEDELIERLARPSQLGWDIAKANIKAECHHSYVNTTRDGIHELCIECFDVRFKNDHLEDSREMVCEHESDGYTYITNHSPREYSRKCIKCGEFYK